MDPQHSTDHFPLGSMGPRLRDPDVDLPTYLHRVFHHLPNINWNPNNAICLYVMSSYLSRIESLLILVLAQQKKAMIDSKLLFTCVVGHNGDLLPSRRRRLPILLTR